MAGEGISEVRASEFAEALVQCSTSRGPFGNWTIVDNASIVFDSVASIGPDWGCGGCSSCCCRCRSASRSTRNHDPKMGVTTSAIGL